jgi:hypothetical protein
MRLRNAATGVVVNVRDDHNLGSEYQPVEAEKPAPKKSSASKTSETSSK